MISRSITTWEIIPPPWLSHNQSHSNGTGDHLGHSTIVCLATIFLGSTYYRIGLLGILICWEGNDIFLERFDFGKRRRNMTQREKKTKDIYIGEKGQKGVRIEVGGDGEVCI